MNARSITHPLPRPIGILPELAPAKSRQALADKLMMAFPLSEAAAAAIARSIVDPSEVRRKLGEPDDPQVEQISVPGGTLLGIRTQVWARRVMQDPRNPRLLPVRRHPFAIDPGIGSEDAKFRPIPEPRSPEGMGSDVAELTVAVESSHHLQWAVQQANSYVLNENDWRESIASQGVMEAVWLVATTYEHADGTKVTIPTTAEGSSRITAVHDLQGVRVSEILYEDTDTKFRAYLKKLNDAHQRGTTSKDEVIALRCEKIPALVLLGFKPHPESKTSFPTALKSLVALRHVDPPKPWGAGPENESLADEVLDELCRRDLITETERDYYAGTCTKAEAAAAHLPTDPATRAAMIVRLMTRQDDSRFADAIRVAVTSQSTRKKITLRLLNQLSTALILRASTHSPERNDQIRRYLQHAFSDSVQDQIWEATTVDTATLGAKALQEVKEAIVNDNVGEPGPASLELAVRGAYALVVSGHLNADRGTANNNQPDRRTPGQVLDAMRCTVQGVHQLTQALQDFAADKPIRAVGEDGAIVLDELGEEVRTNDVFLRNEFPPPGKAKAAKPGVTPMERYENSLSAFAHAAEQLAQAFAEVCNTVGDDGRPLVETRGASPRDCQDWRHTLREIEDQMVLWANTYKKNLGGSARNRQVHQQLDDEVADDGMAAEPSVVDEWDQEQEQQPVSP